MLMRIRLAKFDDLTAILAISNWAAINTAANFALEQESLESWQEEWRETHELYPYLVAVDDHNTIVGFTKATPWKGRCAYIYSAEVTVYVHPDHHGHGIGKALYGRLMPTLKAQGYHTLLAGITQPNEASVRLHESFGFHRVALFEQVGWKFDQWHDVGYWELLLQAETVRPKPIITVREAASGMELGAG
ncbi:MAG: N-acetyltransferase [Planctomycetes bacterium]|nr:N-acetyltransferase [Planctomycetota bacterium]